MTLISLKHKQVPPHLKDYSLFPFCNHKIPDWSALHTTSCMTCLLPIFPISPPILCPCLRHTEKLTVPLSIWYHHISSHIYTHCSPFQICLYDTFAYIVALLVPSSVTQGSLLFEAFQEPPEKSQPMLLWALRNAWEIDSIRPDLADVRRENTKQTILGLWA